MDPAQIARVRRFNRFLTRRVGALETSYLSRGRPLGEARLIFEIGEPGVTVRALRDALDLDSGYVSRLLRSLVGQGLVEVRKSGTDSRLRTVSLTDAGRAERAVYEHLSDDLAAAMLAPLDAGERARVVAAMAEVERLIRSGEVSVALEPPDSADARRCLQAYFRELAGRFETGFDPSLSNPASAADLVPPAGFFFLARQRGRAVGCGALKRRSDGSGEVKRMWTAPAARGTGVARTLLRRIEERARAENIALLRLETNRALTEAQNLYRSEGFVEVAPFNDEPYAHHWFEKRL